MEIINLTPHSIDIYNEEEEKIISFPPSGEIARANEEVEDTGKTVNDIPVVKKHFSGVKNLPTPKKNVIFIVSGPVLEGAEGRNDLICPDTGGDSVVRDDEGNILGVKRFFVYD